LKVESIRLVPAAALLKQKKVLKRGLKVESAIKPTTSDIAWKQKGLQT